MGVETLNADPSHGAQSRLIVAGKTCVDSCPCFEKAYQAISTITIIRLMIVINRARRVILWR